MMILTILLGGFVGWWLDILGERLVRLAGYGDRRPRLTGARRLRLRFISASLLAVGAGWLSVEDGLSLALPASVVLAFLLLLTIIDIQYRLILNLLIVPALFLALGTNLVLLQQPPLTILLGGVFAFGIFYATALVRPGELGGGDVKLALLIGLVLGFPHVLYALMSGALLGATVALWLRFVQKRSWGSTIPYAPFLCAGAAAVLLITVL